MAFHALHIEPSPGSGDGDASQGFEDCALSAMPISTTTPTWQSPSTGPREPAKGWTWHILNLADGTLLVTSLLRFRQVNQSARVIISEMRKYKKITTCALQTMHALREPAKGSIS
jgi:hypothetical protein